MELVQIIVVCFKNKNFKYINIPNEGDMLFNLETDPHELNDFKTLILIK